MSPEMKPRRNMATTTSHTAGHWSYGHRSIVVRGSKIGVFKQTSCNDLDLSSTTTAQCVLDPFPDLKIEDVKNAKTKVEKGKRSKTQKTIVNQKSPATKPRTNPKIAISIQSWHLPDYTHDRPSGVPRHYTRLKGWRVLNIYRTTIFNQISHRQNAEKALNF